MDNTDSVYIMATDTLSCETTEDRYPVGLSTHPEQVLLELMMGEQEACQGYELKADITHGHSRTLVWTCNVYASFILTATMHGTI